MTAWLVDRSVRPHPLRQGLIFLGHPLGYGVFCLIRVDSRSDRRLVPLPVLDPRVHGYLYVTVMMIFVAIVGLALAWLLCWTSRRDFARQGESSATVDSAHR